MRPTVAKNRISKDPVESIERGLAHIREIGLDVQARPLKEFRLQMGLDMGIVYFTLRVPVAGGITLRVPALMTIKPRVYSPTRAQHR
jgi:hypothetical protein